MSDSEPRGLAGDLPPPSPFDDLIGLQIDTAGAQQVTAHLDVDDRHHQPFGIVHGGVFAAIVETVASVGAQLAVAADGQGAVGVHNATDFIRPHVAGRLSVRGEAVHQGRTQQLWQVVVSRTSDGRTVARGQVRLAVVPADDA